MSFFSWLGKVFASKPQQKNNLHSLSDKALEMVINYEVGGKGYYDRVLHRPTWPRGASGVTIGIGYDLGYNSVETIKSDWGKHLSDDQIERLCKVSGVTGVAANDRVASVKDISIPWEAAIEVFKKTSVPKFIGYTLKAFPKSEELHPDAFGALVSLVFNRGASMKGSRRAEMRSIRSLVPDKDYHGIANQIRAMKRIWRGKGLDGLLKRREAEAKLVESCVDK